MRQLADLIRGDDPELSEVLTKCRFVDDLNESIESLQAALRLKVAVDDDFTKLGVKVKGWAIARQPPAPEISEDGYVGVASMAWHIETDTVELKLNDLHFGKLVCGRLHPDTSIFKGSIADNRTAQIRRGTPNEHIYHVISSANVADIPTRPNRCTIKDVGPGREWEEGRPWMKKELSTLFTRRHAYPHNCSEWDRRKRRGGVQRRAGHTTPP